MKDGPIFELTMTETRHRPSQFKKLRDALPVFCPDKNYGKEYRSKPKKNKRNQRKWINKTKIRWKDQPQVSSFPDHLLQKNDPPIEGVQSAIAKELQSLLDRARVHGMEQINDSVYYDSNGEADDNDEDDDNTFQDAIQVEDYIDDTDDDDSTIY